MSAGLFPVLMVVTIGALAGAGIGLGIGYLAGIQKPAWADMTRSERRASTGLVIIFSVVIIAGLAWSFLW